MKKINKDLIVINSSEYSQVENINYFRSGIEVQIQDLSKFFKKTYVCAPKTREKFKGFQYSNDIGIIPLIYNLHQTNFEFLTRINEYKKRLNLIIEKHKKNSIFMVYFPDSFLGVMAIQILKKRNIKHFVRITADLGLEFRNRDNKLHRKILYYLINPIIYFYFKHLLKKSLCFYSGYQIYNKGKLSHSLNSSSIHKSQIGKDLKKFELSDIPKVIYVGRFDRKKGLKDLIKAFEYIKSNCKLEIIGFGSDDEEKEIKELININKNKKNIKNIGFMNYDEKLFKRYKNADILAFPSLEDKQGKSYIEGILFHCLILTSKNQGAKEILTNNKNCIYFKPGDFKDLAQKLDYLIQNKKIHQKLYKNSRTLLHELTVERMNEKIITEVLKLK